MAVTNFDGAAEGDLRKMPAMYQRFPVFFTEKSYKKTQT